MHARIEALCVGPVGTPAAAVADASVLDATVVRTVEDAITTLETAPYDVVVTAETLPDGSGLALAEWIGDACPVVLCPEHGSESLAGDAVSAGVDAYVPAADAPDVLVPRIEAAVAPEDSQTAMETADSPSSPAVPSAGTDQLSALLFEQAPFAIIEWTPEFEVRSWNPAAEALFGYDEETAAGQPPTELILPEEKAESVLAGWTELLTGERTTLHGVTRNRTAAGDTVICEWHSIPRRDSNGQIVGVLSFARDITDQRHRADRLAALHESTTALFQAGDKTTVAERAVGAATTVLGVPVAELFLAEDDELSSVAIAGDGADDCCPATAMELVRTAATEDDVVYEPQASHPNSPDQPVSIACYPLGNHGVLVLAAPEPDAFEEIDRNVGQVLAAATTAAIQQAEYHRSLERSRAIVDAIGDGVYALDASGYIRAANDVLAEMAGYEQAVLEGRHVSTLLDEAAIERGNEIVREIIHEDGVETQTATFELHTSDGSTVPCEITVSALEEHGEFAGTVGIVRDITDHREMEAQLRERKHKIEALYDATTTIESCRKPTEVCTVAVQAAEQLFSVDWCALALTDDDGFFVCATDDEGEVRHERQSIDGTVAARAYEAGEPARADATATETIAGNTAGSVYAVPVGDYGALELANSAASFDSDDEELVELLVAHVVEALDRMAYESELRSERDRLAALLENVPDPVVVTDHTDGEPIVTDVNSAFEDVFGYDKQALLGKSLDDYIVPPEYVDEADRLGDRAAQGETIETEVKRETATGQRDFLLRVVPLEVDQSVTYAVYTDITDRKQQQNRVEVLNRVLRHDLRNGMNIIKGSAEVIGDRAPEDGIEPHARTIQQRADELLALAEKTREIEQTLDREERRVTPRDIVEITTAAIESVHAEFPDAAFDFDHPDKAHARADEMVDRALYHLIHNAVDHNDERIPSIEVTIEREAHHVEIQITDNGPGIPDAEYELISEQREITQLRHASGLGLWVANWAITQSGGSITFEDNDPKGTIATVRLPIATANDATTEAEERSA